MSEKQSLIGWFLALILVATEAGAGDVQVFLVLEDPPLAAAASAALGQNGGKFTVAARQAVVREQPDAEFVMLSPDERCRLAAESHPRAVWHRRVSEPEYLRCLQQSDLLVLPLRRSTTANAVLEAMACGLPVITNAGGIEDYLDPESSVVLPAGDVEGMAAAVRRLLGDREERERMSRAARRRACEFSWRRTAEQMAGIYGRLLAPGENGTRGKEACAATSRKPPSS